MLLVDGRGKLYITGYFQFTTNGTFDYEKRCIYVVDAVAGSAGCITDGYYINQLNAVSSDGTVAWEVRHCLT